MKLSDWIMPQYSGKTRQRYLRSFKINALVVLISAVALILLKLLWKPTSPNANAWFVIAFMAIVLLANFFLATKRISGVYFDYMQFRQNQDDRKNNLQELNKFADSLKKKTNDGAK